jgi:hypothetical protein
MRPTATMKAWKLIIQIMPKVTSDDTEEEPIPEQTTFTCLTNVDLLQLVFGIPGTQHVIYRHP